jgi:hypothetical protein
MCSSRFATLTRTIMYTVKTRERNAAYVLKLWAGGREDISPSLLSFPPPEADTASRERILWRGKGRDGVSRL